MLSCEAEQLTQHFQAFAVYASSCFENHWHEIETCAFEVFVVFVVFLGLSITLAWFSERQIVRAERTRNCNVYGYSFV